MNAMITRADAMKNAILNAVVSLSLKSNQPNQRNNFQFNALGGIQIHFFLENIHFF